MILFIVTLVWFLIVITIGIKGNLSRIARQQNKATRPIAETRTSVPISRPPIQPMQYEHPPFPSYVNDRSSFAATLRDIEMHDTGASSSHAHTEDDHQARQAMFDSPPSDRNLARIRRQSESGITHQEPVEQQQPATPSSEDPLDVADNDVDGHELAKRRIAETFKVRNSDFHFAMARLLGIYQFHSNLLYGNDNQC